MFYFSLNSTVTATGMTVNATADASLVIKGSTDTNFTAVGTNATSVTSLKPTTSFDGTNFGKLDTDVKVKSAASAVATWTGTSGAFDPSDLVLIAAGEKSTYVVTSDYQIKNVGANADHVYVEAIRATISSGTNPLLPSLRVAIQLGTGTVRVFNAGGGTNLAEGVGKYESTTWSLATKTYDVVDKQANDLGSLTANEAKTVHIYIWFEGQDNACFSDNVRADNITVEVDFTTTQPAS